jgi:hypothetical protein
MCDISGKVEHCLAILKLHVDVRRIMFVEEHANDNAEESADLGHYPVPFDGSIVRRNSEEYNGRRRSYAFAVGYALASQGGCTGNSLC